MGFFDSIADGIGGFVGKVTGAAKGVANSVGETISSAVNTVKGGASSIISSVSGTATDAFNLARTAVETVYRDGKEVILGAPERISTAAGNLLGSAGNAVGNVLGAGGNALSNVGSSLTLPLTVAAGIAAIVLLKK